MRDDLIAAIEEELSGLERSSPESPAQADREERVRNLRSALNDVRSGAFGPALLGYLASHRTRRPARQ